MATAPRKPPTEWDLEAKRLIKSAMALRGYSYESLADALEKSGAGDVTAKSVALRVNRAAFSMGFALQLLVLMGVQNLDISHLKLPKRAST